MRYAEAGTGRTPAEPSQSPAQEQESSPKRAALCLSCRIVENKKLRSAFLWGARNLALESKPEFLQHSDGALIVERGNGDKAAEPERAPAEIERRLGGLGCVALAASCGQEGEPQLDIRVPVAPE